MRTVLTLHEATTRPGVNSGTDRFRRFFHQPVDRLYRKLANLIVVHTQSEFESLTPREKRKAVVIPHGAVVTEREMDSAGRSKTILFFGRSAEYKGIGTLLSAMNEVWKAVPEARLRILASEGDYKCDVDLDDRVDATWSGYSTAELVSALSDARAVCLPYTSVSGTGVGSWAYGSGRPIVASNLDGLRELVAHEELLVEPTNVEDLARALIAVLTKEFEPQQINPERTWPGVAAAHLRAYRQLPGA